MKLLTFAVPCYNSEAYMKKCIDSLLPGGADVEILIIDDGSGDSTAAIADRYAERYPNIVRAIHQENGGHGAAVNTGIANATGLYFKVVDSDDWVDKSSYKKILGTLRSFSAPDEMLDMLVSDFVYEKEGEKRRKVIRYHHAMPQERVFSWEEAGHFRVDQYILMHSVIYRTQILRDCGLHLPEHTFYVDNLYVFNPLPYVQRMFYLDVPFYRYYIGRPDQSVHESVMISRIDQQLRVNLLMAEYMSEKRESLSDRKEISAYMLNYLCIITAVSSMMLLLSGTEQSLWRKKQLWSNIKKMDPWLYRKVRYSLLGSAVNLPGWVGRKVTVLGYRVCQKIYHFN